MGFTIAEKVLGLHVVGGRREVRAGDYVLARPDVILLNDVSGPLAIKQFRQIVGDGGKVADPSKVVFVNDHFVPPPTIEAAINAKLMRQFAGEFGIKLFDVGEGIEHTLLPEQGLVKPGYLVIGGDSHTTTYGAFNAFGSGFGATDIAVALALGYLWFLVPESQRFIFEGDRPPFITGKDLILNVIRDIGVDGATYQSMEFTGDALLKFNIDEYEHIANMAVEAGAKAGIIEANEVIMRWAESKFRGEVINYVRADLDAKYVEVHRYDITKMEPMVAKPHSPGNAVPISEVEGVHVDQVYIGNCANGTLTDLRQAAAVLRGRKVAPGVRLIVVPATRSIYEQALREGLIDIFIKAGAFVSSPTCGACAGLHLGLLADGEVAVATTNRNFRGRMGSAKAEIYLANAYVAAAAAVKGEITDPSKLISWSEVKKFVYGVGW